jgi:hypothetical protein
VPQAIIVTVWLSVHLDFQSCATDFNQCAKESVLPLASLCFSFGSILYGIFKGCNGLKDDWRPDDDDDSDGNSESDTP